MQQAAALSTLQSLGYRDCSENIRSIPDGCTKLLRGDSGQFAAVSRHGDAFDFLVIGADSECPVGTLREFLESAIIPMSDEYAIDIGVAKPERESLRKRIREAAVALDVLAKGQKVRVRPADIAIHPRILQLVKNDENASTESVPEDLANDLALINQLQTQVLHWRKEIDRLVQLSRAGPGATLSAEEETMFWSSLDSAFVNAQMTLSSSPIKISLQLLARNRRATGFMMDVTQILDTGRLRAVGVLNLVQGLPIVALRTADTEENLLKSVKQFWQHMISKLRISSLPIERAMSLTDSVSAEVDTSLKALQKSRGGLLNSSFPSFFAFVEASCTVFEAWAEGYDRCRIAAREIASKRAETLPPRKAPAFATLRTRIEEAFEFRSHNSALRAVFEKQSVVNPLAGSFLEKLDTAYQSVVLQCDTGIALDTSPTGVASWLKAREEYSILTEEIEEAVALQFQEAICGMQNLTAMALFAADFGQLVGRPLMDNATSICAAKVLDIGNCNISALQKQWENHRSGDRLQTQFRHLPAICIKTVQARVIGVALRRTLNEAGTILGSVRMSNDPDLVEFVERIEAFCRQTDAASILKSWLRSSSMTNFRPNCPLLCGIPSHENDDMEIGIDEQAVDVLRAIFFFEQDAVLSSLVEQEILVRAREAQCMVQVHSRMSAALGCYKDACGLVQSVDALEVKLICPLILDKREFARQALLESSKLSCADSLDVLLECAEKCFTSCRLYADTLRALVDEHRFVFESLEALSSVCFKPEVTGRQNDIATNVAEVLRRISSTIRSMRSRVPDFSKFEDYMRTAVENEFEIVYDAVLSQSIYHWITELKAGRVQELKSNLRLSGLGDRYLLDPDVNTIHTSASNALRNLSASSYSVLSTIDFLEEDDPLHCITLPSFAHCFAPDRNASVAATRALQCIMQELERLQANVRLWSSFFCLLSLDKSALLHSISADTESARDVLSSLSSVTEDIQALQQKELRYGETSSYLETAAVSAQLQTAVSATIRDALDGCSEFCAAQTHEIYKLFSTSKASIKNALGKDAIEVVLLLKSVEESVFGETDRKIVALEEIESLIHKTSLVPLPSTWISHEVLSAELVMLKKLHAQRSSTVLVNLAELKSKYRKEKELFEVNLSEFHARSGKVWEEYGSVQSSQGTGDGVLSFPSDDFGLTSLQDEINGLKLESNRLQSIEQALQFERSSSSAFVETLVVEVDTICKSLMALRALSERLAEVGNTTFESFEGRSVRKRIEAINSEVSALESYHGASAAVTKLRTMTDNHLKVHGLLSNLRSCSLSPLRERDILKTIFEDVNPSESVLQKKLHEFWRCNLLKHDSYLREVFDIASGESALAEFLNGVRRTWSSRQPSFIHRDGIKLLDSIPTLVDELQDQLQALSTMAGSQFVALFEEERKSWEARLSLCLDVLEEVTEVQMQWMHLRSLFDVKSAGSSLRKKLRKEFIAFSNVDSQLVSFFDYLEESTGLVEGLNAATGLDRIMSDLNDIVRSLASFLEGQRSLFPRFFFMSDSDLLLVLSMSPRRMETLIPSLGKLFSGIGQLEYTVTEAHGVTTTSIISKEGELLQLCRPIAFEEGSSITDFLSNLDKTLKESLQYLLPKALISVEDLIYADGEITPASLKKTLKHYPSQIFLLASRIIFTRIVEEKLSASANDLNQLLEKLIDKLEDLCRYVPPDGGKGRVYDPMGPNREHVIKELVYQRDTLRILVQENVSSSSAHQWSHQLRAYAEDGERGRKGIVADVRTVTMKCADACFDYGWEYLGVGDTLVQTPLTARCYLTLSQALHRGLGGSPFGPAGTGKTETVKSLGRLLGRNVVVFNCDESFDAVSVGRILAGVSRVGFWVCFDEFNRLSASSLSSTSQQLSILQNAVKCSYRTVDNFYGGDVPISIGSGLGIFITMNPTYSGRRELPSNLKSLFRPCAMPRPDYLVIAEVLLMSYSFRASRALGAKLVHLFNCLKQVIRDRPHYDFGLRSLKSSIIIAGKLRSAIASSQSETAVASLTEADEDRAVVLSLHETLKPRLLPQDVQEYDAYIQNLFPSVCTSDFQLPENLHNAVCSSAKERNFEVSTSFLQRIGQLYNLLKHRPGVMLVGDAGCGKSASWQILFESLRRLSDTDKNSESTIERRSSLIVLDPKLLSAAQLYGSLDLSTREWTDGIFTKKLRDCALLSETSQIEDFLNWIVFDGDIDPNWVENLNSVLDDTRLLTLPSGERIPLSPSIRILFEVDNLKHANPSTVSRCGLVYFDQGVPLSSVLKSQLENTLTKAGILSSIREEILRISDTFAAFCESIPKYGKGILRQPLCSFVSGVMDLFSSLLTQLLSARPLDDPVEVPKEEKDIAFGKLKSSQSIGTTLTPAVLARCFFLSAKTAIGSSFARDDAVALNSALLKHMQGCSHFLDMILADYDGTSLFGAAFDCKTATSFNFATAAREEIVLENLPSQIGSPDIVIPTPSSMRLTQVVRDAIWNQEVLHCQQSLVVLCGPPGCGKSMLLTSALNDLPGVELATMSMSSRTTITDVIAVLKAHMEVSKNLNGDLVLSPKAPHKQTVLFCDEVNLGEPDEYGTQYVANFLRCLVERKGFWSGILSRWTHVKGLRIVAACNPAEDAGRHHLPARLMRHAILVRVEQPNRHDLLTIFNVHMAGLLKYLDCRLESRAAVLTNAMVDFFLANKQRFAPTASGPLEPHYVYSARELIRWVRGMKHILTCNLEFSNVFSSVGSPSRAIEKIWEEVLRAFNHEARRLFMDRLVTKSELNFAEKSLAEVLKHYFGHDGTPLPDMLYSSWLKLDGDDCPAHAFQVVPSIEEFRQLVYQKLRVFAEEEGLGGAWMSGRGAAALDDAIDQFAVTDDVLKHLARIERVLSLPLGHAVLMGVPGTGKKTLARFAAWMLGATVFQVRSHASYTAQDFADDIRNVLRQAGVYDQKVVVIFDESNDLDSAFLEMMNSILACGDVPGLFEGEAKSALLKEIQDNLKGSAATEARSEALYSHFLQGVRTNLHVIFSIPILHEELNGNGDQRSKANAVKDLTSRSPALYNRCVVDWFGDWDSETLQSIADLKLEVSQGEERQMVVNSAVRMHRIAKKHFSELLDSMSAITPRHYLEFIEQLNRIALEKAEAIQQGAARLKEGLQKLRQAGIAVDDLKESLCEKTAHLTQKEAEANDTLRLMSEEQRRAEKSKLDAEKLAVAAEEAAEAARVQQEEVTLQLAAVEPKVIAAREAVGSIRKENLEELRGMPNPPSSVRAALDAVMILLDAATQRTIGSYTWGQIRSRMRDREFIPSILNFDSDLVPAALRQQIEKKIFSNKDFDIERICYASMAAGPLAEWTVAILDYAAVQESVAPLRAEIEALQNEEDELAQKNLEAKRSVSDLEKRIDRCRTQYAVLVGEAERIRSEIQDAEGKLTQAEKMLDSLGEEWERWVSEMKKYNADATTVWGNAVYASAFIAYAGPLDRQQRKNICADWTQALEEEGVEFDNSICLSTFLTSSEDRAFWICQRLPVDETSLQNYAILLRSARYPLIVDPSGKSSDLLKSILGLNDGSEQGHARSMNKRSSLKQHSSCTISTSSFAQTGKKSYIRAVESAVRFGTSVLVEHAERFDFTVLPLLGQESSFGNSTDFRKSASPRQAGQGTTQDMKRSQQRLVRLGDRDVALSPGFRMFLSTGNISEVPVAAVSRTSVVSFAMSAAALQAKCVSRTLTALQPAIEEQRTSYIISSLACEQRKKELEDSLLLEISKAEDVGTELLRGTLLQTLTNLKEETIRVHEQERENNVAADEAKMYEEMYQNLANAGLCIYNVLENLQALNPLYRFSPSEFFGLFDSALVEATKTGYDPAPSPFDIHRELVRVVYLHVVPSLFPPHKLAFACALVIAAMQFRKSGTDSYLNPQHVLEIRDALAKTSNASSLSETVHVEDLKLVEQLFSIMNKNEKLPNSSSEYPEQATFTDVAAQPLCNILTMRSSDTILLPRLFDELANALPGGKETLYGSSTRADIVLSSLMKCIAGSELTDTGGGDQYLPLLLCSRGANSDPCELAATMATQLSITVESIALSNEHTAEVIGNILSLVSRRQMGEPLILLMKNVHLASRKCCERLKREIGKNPQGLPYLLIMAAEVTSGAPQHLVDLAIDCRVLAFEVPSSLRTNLSRCHTVLNASFSDEWLRRTYIAITWLHGALLERRQYSPVGFSKPYSFSEGDLTSAWDAVMNHHKSGVKLADEQSVATLIHLLSTSVYGGRVENQADIQVLHEFVSDLLYRVLLREAKSSTVAVVDASHVEKNIAIPVDDPLMRTVHDELPLLAPTDWFGMPPKTSESYIVRQGRNVMKVFLAFLPSQVQRKHGDEEVVELQDSNVQIRGKIEALLNGLPEIGESLVEKLDSPSALRRYLEREQELCSECVQILRDDLVSLIDVIDGRARESARSRSLRRTAVSWDMHGSSRIPSEWVSLAKYSSADKSIRGLISKLNSSHRWLGARLCSDDVTEKTVNFSFALRPTSLMAALGQFAAQQAGIPEHTLQPVLGSKTQCEGCGAWSVEGLTLEGGLWSDEHRFVVFSDGSSNDLPTCTLWWGDSKALDRAASKNGFVYIPLPLYDSGSRERLVCELFVPMDRAIPRGKWRLSATALMISRTTPEEVRG